MSKSPAVRQIAPVLLASIVIIILLITIPVHLLVNHFSNAVEKEETLSPFILSNEQKADKITSALLDIDGVTFAETVNTDNNSTDITIRIGPNRPGQDIHGQINSVCNHGLRLWFSPDPYQVNCIIK